MVIEQLSKLLSFIDILITDKKAIIVALSSDFKDFEDAIQNYSAELSHEIEVIITRNIKDYKHSRLSIMTPDEYLKDWLKTRP